MAKNWKAIVTKKVNDGCDTPTGSFSQKKNGYSVQYQSSVMTIIAYHKFYIMLDFKGNNN